VSLARSGALACGLAIVLLHAAPAPAAGPAPSAVSFSAANGGAPFAGDGRLLTTISPNGDGLRDRATIRFTLDRPAVATLELLGPEPDDGVVFRHTAWLPTGPASLEWPAAHPEAGDYLVRVTLTGAGGARRVYDVRRASDGRSVGAPVVRVLGIEAAFAHESAAPGSVATLSVATDEPSFSLQLFHAGPERRPTYADDVMNGVAVTQPVEVGWRAHPNRPATVRVPIGAWASGLYFAKLTARDGRVGYAPLVVRPARPGASRVAVVMPTNTWEAYNFRDEDGNGLGDTWYAGCPCTVRLHRPFLDRGVPPHFRRYDLPFLHWLSSTGRAPDFLTDAELENAPDGDALARRYDLLVFEGHHEYVTRHEYDVVRRYRDLGGNLEFLSANNFFWRVDLHGGRLTRVAKWRDLGLPEAALIGAQYRANDEGQRKGAYVVRGAALAPWLFEGTGLVDGSRFTGFGYAAGPFGIEIDATAAASPPGTEVLAEIPDLYGPGITAQMTYYETPAGAKVFAAGAFSLAGAATWQPVTRLLDNLWAALSVP
jgi:hypothetical protein